MISGGFCEEGPFQDPRRRGHKWWVFGMGVAGDDGGTGLAILIMTVVWRILVVWLIACSRTC